MTQPEMNKPWRWLWISAAALFLGVVLWVWSHPPSKIVLPDGTSVRYLGSAPGHITFNTEHVGHRWARRLLPSKLHFLIPETFSHYPMRDDPRHLVAYVKVVSPRRMGHGDRMVFAVEDADGFRRPPETTRYHRGGFTNVVALHLRNFPRRQKSIQIHLLDERENVLGTLMVDNPLPRSFAQWRPDPLPITRTNGPITLTLEGLTLGDSDPSQPVEAVWTLASADPRWSHAAFQRHDLADVTGNNDTRRPVFTTPPRMPLSPAEPAWKLSVMMRRERPEDFLPEERMMLTNLVIPKAGGVTPFHMSATHLGVDRIVGFVGGGGPITPAERPKVRSLMPAQVENPANRMWLHEGPFLRVELEGIAKEDAVLIIAHDTRGGARPITNSRPFHFSSYSRSLFHPPGTNDVFIFEGPLPSDSGAGPQSLEILVSRALRFEFLIDPKEVVAKGGLKQP